MPSWFVHMNVAKKTINGLTSNPRVAAILGANGATAADIESIAKNNPAYVALGSIGPDLFVFLPDFKPPLGPPIYNIMKFMEGFYDVIDPYITAYEDSLGPILDEAGDIANALTGGLLQTVSDTGQQLANIYAVVLEDFVTSQYDWFSILGSGVPSGYDEQTFFWSDMLHYRRTYEFGAHLWKNAKTDQEKAYALGWMTHIGTDVVGHSFVNQKTGGPFRLHWQRHHLVENHMDAYVYDREFGAQSQYQSLCGAAQHLWIAFPENGTPVEGGDFFHPDTRPTFDPKDKQAKAKAWDVDSKLPDSLRDLLLKTLQDVYPSAPSPPQTAGKKDQCADHPAILKKGYPNEDDVPPTDFYVAKIPNHGDIETAYFYLYKYVKMITTDYYNMQPPGEPPVFPWPAFPSPPGNPDPDGSADGALSVWDIILSIFSWLLFIAECIAWFPAAVAAGLLGPLTWPAREAVYQFIELPLYNAWLSLHWLLSITGYALPLPGEITPALHTLGIGFQDNWTALQAELNDLSGGLLGAPAMLQTESSGVDRDESYPRDVVSDPKSSIPTIPSQVLSLFDNDESCSEFTRPWRWPRTDNQGDIIPTEYPRIGPAASPYRSGQDAYVLMADAPGDKQFRKDLENSTGAVKTIQLVTNGLKNNKHLGDPSDYSAYVVARLTRDDIVARTPDQPGSLVNFNLDADRGYGFLCWDWLRCNKVLAAPSAYRDSGKTLKSTHIYHAPCQAGSGWDVDDILAKQSIPSPPPYTQHNPYQQDNYLRPVQIRYIDLEEKFV